MTVAAAARTRLDHRFARRRASDYIDGELRTRQRRRLEAHAAVCPECARMVRTLLALVRRLPALCGPGAPSVAAVVIERLRGEAAPTGLHEQATAPEDGR
jgi:anti-sigma factor RsiW